MQGCLDLASGIGPGPLVIQRPLLFEYFSEMNNLFIRECTKRVFKGQ